MFNCDTCQDNLATDCRDCEQHQQDKMKAIAAFDKITWTRPTAARADFTTRLLLGKVSPAMALRQTESYYTQLVTTRPTRTPKERKSIERVCAHARGRLEATAELLHLIELGHQRGQDWVPLAEAPWHAVEALKKLKVLKVIKFDGDYFGQLEGAL